MFLGLSYRKFSSLQSYHVIKWAKRCNLLMCCIFNVPSFIYIVNDGKFQVLTAMAFTLFAQENVDITVVEVNRVFHLNYFFSSIVCIFFITLFLSPLSNSIFMQM